MLRHLRATNFAILSDVALELTPGFNVLTGETGAGKSLIVEAVNLLRGGRASADIPRAGATEAVVEAIVEVPDDLAAAVTAVLDEAGLPDQGTDLLIRRVIHRGGRSRTYVNGALTTASRLAELGAMLVDLSGQHQHQGLVDPKRHRTILDAFAEEPATLGQMKQSYTRLATVRTALDELGADERQRSDRMDYLRFQLDEIDEAGLESEEDENLERERDRLAAADKLCAAALGAEALVYANDGSAVEQLDQASAEIERVASIDTALAGPLAQLVEARALADEAATALRHYTDELDGDPQRLAEVEDRLQLVRRLTRKHGGSVAEVLSRAKELRTELDTLDNHDLRTAELEKELAAATSQAKKTATKLTRIRRAAAKTLVTEVGRALAELGMPSAQLSVDLVEKPIGEHGADRVEIRLRSNKGEDAKPLAKVASGGELSRIMLALKLVLRRADEVATYVFDEVDAGIGGATAEVVGKQIRSVADHRQVLCVTHLPQIAAFADSHFHVAKSEVDGRTETAVSKLAGNARRDEMARMLGGVKVTARAHAREMLEAAGARRR
jgi:DNA repair protein RecN (Recombination protein N)